MTLIEFRQLLVKQTPTDKDFGAVYEFADKSDAATLLSAIAGRETHPTLTKIVNAANCR